MLFVVGGEFKWAQTINVRCSHLAPCYVRDLPRGWDSVFIAILGVIVMLFGLVGQ